MSDFYYPILIPIAAGVVCLLIPQKLKAVIKTIAMLAAAATFVFVIGLFSNRASGEYFANDGLSGFVLLAAGLFGVLSVLYSLAYMADKPRLSEYYGYMLMTLGAACGAILANNLILLLVLWGFLALTLYLLIGIGGARSAQPAKKTLIIVGGSDAVMVLGIAIIWQLAGSAKISDIAGSPLALKGTLPIIAYLAMLIGCFAKAGAMPLHTWIPDMAETAPTPVTAFLPASLDKLLGIYLLARLNMHIFALSGGWGLVLLIVGAVTIIAAVMMALVQHDLRRLLSYHAVSQVGYMVLGIGTGSPIGIAGGLFHMLNNTIYKQGLFLAGGAVEQRTGTNDLSKLGGLAKVMPITFITCLIAALAISGVPPLNGFVSKWMVYQSIIDVGKGGDKLWLIWLVAAMFGSALTLASFTKLIHAVFLGQGASKREPEVKEVSPAMWIPMGVLALLCVVFGIFAYAVPLKHLILPAVDGVSFSGIWSPGLATLMILIGIVLGLIIYLLSNLKGFRVDSTYIGGEILPAENRITGVDFYGSVKDTPVLKGAYDKAENKVFDLYEQGKKLTLCISDKLKEFHTGILRTYLVWCLLGLIILMLVLMS